MRPDGGRCGRLRRYAGNGQGRRPPAVPFCPQRDYVATPWRIPRTANSPACEGADEADGADDCDGTGGTAKGEGAPGNTTPDVLSEV
jgi:hypothetical protein